jgi:hypothetical protein
MRLRSACALPALFWGTIAAAGDQPANGPRIGCASNVVDLGVVTADGHADAAFVISNDGTQPLEILEVKPSCGCMVARLKDRTIPPGSETVIDVRFSGKGRDGPQRQSVRVKSNDPVQPELDLWIRGRVVPDIVEIFPSRLFLGRLAPRQTVTARVDIAVHTASPHGVTNVWTDSRYLACFLRRGAAASTATLTVVSKPPLPKGDFSTSIRIDTDLPQNPSRTVEVSAFVAEDLVVFPQELILSPQETQRVTRSFTLRSAKRVEFKLLEVKPPDPSATVDVEPLDRGGYRVTVRDLDASPKTPGIVRVRTDYPGRETVEIPIRRIPPAP